MYWLTFILILLAVALSIAFFIFMAISIWVAFNLAQVTGEEQETDYDLVEYDHYPYEEELTRL